MALDLRTVKLGRSAVSHNDARTLKFGDYLKSGSLPVHPNSVDYTAGITNWGMLGNDKYGDCTAAGWAHSVMVWAANHGITLTFSEAQAVAMYAAVSGFNPATGANDNGAELIDCLKYVSANGFCGHKLAAYVQVDPKNIEHVREALFLFGVLYAGFNVPSSVDGGENTNEWTYDPKAVIAGGHCVPLPKFDMSSFTCLTWGYQQQLDLEFFSEYFDEVWAPVSLDWVTPALLAPNRFDFAQLMADRTTLTG